MADVATDPQRPQLNWAQIQAEIKERAEEEDLDIEELPRRQNHVWVAKRTSMEVQMMLELLRSGPAWSKMKETEQAAKLDGLMSDMTPMTLTRAKPWPPNPNYVIAEIFDDDAEIRVYAVPQSAPTTPVIAAMRYRISKASHLPTYTVDALWIDTWIDAIVDEWSEIDGEVNAETHALQEGMETECETTIAYLKTLKEGYRIVDLIADLKDGTHRQVEIPEEEEEGEQDEEEQQTPGQAAAEPQPSNAEATTPPAGP
jgi:hypothetical protein